MSLFFIRLLIFGSPTDKLSEEKKEISKLYMILSQKLDALTNFHFTPKPLMDDMQIKSNVAALEMEEITPAAVRLSAPSLLLRTDLVSVYPTWQVYRVECRQCDCKMKYSFAYTQVSDAQLLAPEEIFDKKKAELVATTEQTQAERKVNAMTTTRSLCFCLRVPLPLRMLRYGAPSWCYRRSPSACCSSSASVQTRRRRTRSASEARTPNARR